MDWSVQCCVYGFDGVRDGPSIISSMCIVNSAKRRRRVFHKLDRTGGTSYQSPSYSWNTIDLIVEHSRTASERVVTVNGLARKMYKEYGYR